MGLAFKENCPDIRNTRVVDLIEHFDGFNCSTEVYDPWVDIDAAMDENNIKLIEEPTKGKGLYFMDTSSAAAECVTLQAAGGFNIHLFPTGQGNIIGNPIEPVVKLTANPLTAKLMSEHVDCDVSKILTREMNLDQAGDKLIETTLKVANGRLTCAEALGHREFVMTKLYRSA